MNYFFVELVVSENSVADALRTFVNFMPSENEQKTKPTTASSLVFKPKYLNQNGCAFFMGLNRVVIVFLFSYELGEIISSHLRIKLGKSLSSHSDNRKAKLYRAKMIFNNSEQDNSTAIVVSTATTANATDLDYSLPEQNIIKDTSLSHIIDRQQFADAVFQRTGVRRDKDALDRKRRELEGIDVVVKVCYILYFLYFDVLSIYEFFNWIYPDLA